jgi:hypothetical protein
MDPLEVVVQLDRVIPREGVERMGAPSISSEHRGKVIPREGVESNLYAHSLGLLARE